MLPARNESVKSDLVEKQSIDSGETLLSRSVLSLVGVLQGTNSIGVLLVRNESMKSDPAEEQSIDSGETLLLGSVLSLAGVLQGTNSIRVLLVKNESRDEYSGSILDLIDCNQMKILHFELAFIIEKNNDQMGRVQFAFVVEIINYELYILQPDRIERVEN